MLLYHAMQVQTYSSVWQTVLPRSQKSHETQPHCVAPLADVNCLHAVACNCQASICVHILMSLSKYAS